MKKKILITGISGQDGAYLANFLINKKNIQIHGLTRKNNKDNLWRLKKLNIYKKFNIITGDLTEYNKIFATLHKYKFDEIYNFAGYSNNRLSSKNTKIALKNNVTSLFNLLNIYCDNKKIKIFHSLSSEIFGKTNIAPQNEKTNLNPVTPYGLSKSISFTIVKKYRRFFDTKIYSGILYNHDSFLRGKDFVLKKIISSFKEFKKNKSHNLKLGNISAKRDWGYAPEYVEGIWKLLQKGRPDDYIFSSGKTYSVKDIIEYTAKLMKIEVNWVLKGNLIAYINKNKKMKIIIDKKLIRNKDTGIQKNLMRGSNQKLYKEILWKPKISIKETINLIINDK